MNSKRKATKKLGTSRLTDELKKEDCHTRVMRIFEEKEKLKSKLDKREQVRLERLKIAAESGKLRITCKGIYETLPCIDCNQHHKVASIKLENSHKKACYRPGILSATPSTSYCSEVQYSEDRQVRRKTPFIKQLYRLCIAINLNTAMGSEPEWCVMQKS